MNAQVADRKIRRCSQGDVAEHDHIRVAMRDSFAAMEQELNRWKHKVGGEVKAHDGSLQGQVVEIHHEEGTVELVVQADESEIRPQDRTVRKIGAMSFDPTARPVP